MINIKTTLILLSLTSCMQGDDKKELNAEIDDAKKELAVSELSRINWNRKNSAIWIESSRGKLSENLVNEIYFQGLVYDLALEYGDREFDTSLHVRHIQYMIKTKQITEERLKDPLSLNKYYEINPKGYPITLNLSEKVVKGVDNYASFVKWFNKKLKK